jgi:uncharacterized protein (UPF0216 family)
MNLEISKINQGVVTERKSLSSLLDEKKPGIKTKAGGEYIFRLETLNVLSSQLPERLASKIRLPVLCYFDSSVGDSCFITDDSAAEALKCLHEISDLREMTDGRLWIGKPIIYAIMNKYPSFIQIVMR